MRAGSPLLGASLGQPGASSFLREVSGRSHKETWVGCSSPLHSVRCLDSFLLGIEDADGVVEACDLEDVLVVIGEAVGEEPLLLAVDADEQRDQEPYAATVHVLEALEVQDDGADPVAGL